MPERLRIAVTGLAATYPLGGVFWDYAQYLLGFKRLGHEVLYIEDSGKWCYDVRDQTFVPDGGRNAAHFARQVSILDPDLAHRWFFRDAAGRVYGRPWADVAAFCRDADLFLHISASCWMRDEYFAAGHVAFLDSDPMYTQASVPDWTASTDPARLPAVDVGTRPSAMLFTLIRHRVQAMFGQESLMSGARESPDADISPRNIALYLAYRLVRAPGTEICHELGIGDPAHFQSTVDAVHSRLPHDRDLADAVNRVTGQLRVDLLRQHDMHFTFAENIGAPDCSVPDALFHWIPTRQPVVLSSFADATVPLGSRRQVLTTVASWESAEGGPVVNGVPYGGKNVEFERFIDLPARVSVPMELALSGRPPRERLTQHGWRLADAGTVSSDPWVYRDFLAQSLGEWSVAKHAYVASRSGWFSCRTACYLALGVPAVVQDTGFGTALPTGEGLLAFSTTDDAAAAIEQVAANPERHARAAHEIAGEYFDSDRVLSVLLEQVATSGQHVRERHD